MYGMSRIEAESFAIALRDRVGSTHDEDPGKMIVGYVVSPYPGTRLFGVVERWVYAGNPEMGEFGGGFAWKD